MRTLREITDEKKCYFIADIAANHDGDLSRAKDLIFLAREAGADVAKFQHFLPNKIVSDEGFQSLGEIKTHQSSWKKSVYDVYEQYHTKREWDETLYSTCQEAGIEFMTTPYDLEAINSLDKFLNVYKIGSGDITYKPLIEELIKKGKNIILATGASELGEVQKAMDLIVNNVEPDKIGLLQCNTNYTGSLDNFNYINLAVLQKYSQLYPQVILGLSDHTPGHATVLGAVALGAKIIEKHFTDDNSREGPDHKFAMNPETWREMVDRTQELILAMGDGKKVVEPNEQESIIVQRRSIRAAKTLSYGTTLTVDDVTFLRPCTAEGLTPWELQKLVGKALRCDVSKGEEITHNHVI